MDLLNYIVFDKETGTITGVKNCTEYYEGYREFPIADVVIPQEIEGVKVEKIAKEAFYGCYGIESLIFQENLKEISEAAFYGCQVIDSVVIPEGVESIEDYAFQDCYRMTHVIIPSTVKKIGENAFSLCPSYGLTLEINVNQKKDLLPGAPWGATSDKVVVKWKE